MQSVEAWSKFNQLAGTLGQDPERYKRLQKAEARYWGKAYEAREYAWTEEFYPGALPGSKGIPIPPEDKRPSRQYNIATRATDDAVDLLCGEGRFPTLTVANDEAATGALDTLAKHARLELFTREMATRMITAGAAAMTLRFDAIPARWATLDVWSARYCIPTFGDDDPTEAARIGAGPRELVSLRVQYVYPVHYPTLGGTVREPDWYIFRRDYTADAVIDYEPWLMPQGRLTEVPRFTEAARVLHGLGRVPAVWVRSRYVEHEIDGPGLFEAVDTLLDGIDTDLSLLDSSVKYATAPLFVVEGLGAQEAGKTDIAGGHGNSLWLPARNGVTPRASFAEHTGTAHSSAREHIAELRNMALEVMRVVVRRDSDTTGALSGTALQLLYRPMLSLVSGYRTAIEDGIRAMAELLLAAGARYGSTLALAEPLPAYTPGAVQLDWPPVFQPTADEIAQLAQALAAAVMAGLLSRETAIGQVAALLRISDVGAELQRIQADREQAQAEARAAFDAAMGDTASGSSGNSNSSSQRSDPSAPSA